MTGDESVMRSTAYKPTYEIDGTVPGNNSEQHLLLLMLTACRVTGECTRVPSGHPRWSEVCLSAPASTLLTVSSAVILPAPV
jgi:hypothetical protein